MKVIPILLLSIAFAAGYRLHMYTAPIEVVEIPARPIHGCRPSPDPLHASPYPGTHAEDELSL